MYIKMGLIIVVLTLFLSACNTTGKDIYTFEEVKGEKIDHMHGLGYTNGEDAVMIATHEGLYEYDGKWKAATSRKHDYMGFSAVKEGFYSSGHPEPNSDLKNPLGIIKSEDKGSSFKQLDFYGEADFHYMTAGYETNTIYLINEAPIGNLDVGLHYSENEGESWKNSEMDGFESRYISNLAAHPTNSSKLVIGSQEGLYLSTDSGNKFTRLGSATVITYVTLTEKAGIYASIENDKVKLMSVNLENSDLEELNVPDFSQNNPIVQIAVNPTNEQEITIATYENDIYQTEDLGTNWKMIAEKGTLQE